MYILAQITKITCNASGTLLCSASQDKSLKIFDVVNFDMINMMRLDFVPETVEWVHGPGDAIHALAVSDSESPAIHIYDGQGSETPIQILKGIHQKPAVIIKYNQKFETAVSVDRNGFVGKL